VVVADVDVEEVDDIAEAEAVEEVADCAAEDQVEADLQHAVGHCRADGVDHHDEEDRQGAGVEQKGDEL
jgi:hypothetical protein